MIGDWVFVNDVEHLRLVPRLVQIRQIRKAPRTFYAEAADPNGSGKVYIGPLSSLVPVEITGKALEASGLRKKERPDGLREWEWISPDGSAVIAVYESEDAPPMVILSHDRPEREHFRVTAAVNHIHQLQHLCNFCSFPLTIKPA